MVTYVSRPWLFLMLLACLVSSVHLNFGGGHALRGSVGVTGLTAVLLALIWLPALVRLLGIAGGEIKTPAGDATTPGLGRLFASVDPQTKRETFPSLLTALTSPGVLTDPHEHEDSRALRQEIGSQLAAVTPGSGDPEEALARYARLYEEIRDRVQPGDERTRQMTRLTAEVRAIANTLPRARIDLARLLSEGSDGERIIALAAAQDRPAADLFGDICDAILSSRSAFEQFHALVAMLELFPLLEQEQRARLAGVLLRAEEDPDRAIRSDSSRARLVDALNRSITETA